MSQPEKFSFLRFESWPLRVSGLAKANRHRTPRTAESIINEALRVEGFAPHVPHCRIPVIFRGSADGAADRLHRAVAQAKSDGTRLRTDSHVLLTVVASWPYNWDEVRAIDGQVKQVKSWLAGVAVYFDQWAAARGEMIDLAIFHTDEAYPHAHFHILPLGHGMQAKLVHPGTVAQAGLRQAAKNGKLKEGLATASQRALREAMAREREAYYQDCCAQFGIKLQGDNPRKRRTRQGHFWFEELEKKKSSDRDAATNIRPVADSEDEDDDNDWEPPC